MKTNVYIIGMMGSGKTTLGKILAKHFELIFLDMDLLIEERESSTISKIFHDQGELYFRIVEKDVLFNISGSEKIISTGGGIIINPENVLLMKARGHVIYLNASPSILVKRLANDIDNRPLLDYNSLNKKIVELYNNRKNLYEAAADDIVNVDNLSKTEVFLELSKILIELGYNL